MKTILTLLLVVLVSFQVTGQRKGKVDPKDLKIDSLNKAATALTLQVDSLSKELTVYKGVYTTVKEKVFKYNFSPAKTSELIDSLRTTRDSTFTTKTSALEDSIALLTKKNKELQAVVDTLSAKDPSKELALQEHERTKAVADLKQLKELLDAKVITQEEYDLKKQKHLAKL